MDRFVCIHGHFYQPPRENPWLEEVELQEPAYPYHDWNERIKAECYDPNTASRIMNPEGKIIGIVNNYSKISFNFGPTLLYWMERHAPHVYEAILEADKRSMERFSGHGSAIAQVYNHIIMPLANRRDKYTQVKWGIKDFEKRFERSPEGMWLPETAVDVETLEVFAELGLKFTILAPHQAAKIREIGGQKWFDVTGGKIDPKRAYLCRLPSGNSINIFFYDGAISHEVSFGGLLNNGEIFAKRLVGAFTEQGGNPQLVHIATDGESYGHHHPSGDMALAYCLHYIESNNLARITNYGEFLEKFPPRYEVQIIGNTSWSCVHGVERWRSNCGCNTGTNPGWSQEWRRPLRDAMDWLRERLAPPFEIKASKYLKDPWEARDDYIVVILDRSRQNVERFLAKHARKDLSEEEKRMVLKLLEMQRHAMLMYASDGWFFDEISDIEAVQVMRYATRAMQLGYECLGAQLELEYTSMLKNAPSNIPKFANGAKVFEMFVRPAIVDLIKVGVHYAISSLFNRKESGLSKVYCYNVDDQIYEVSKAGRLMLAIGRSRISSEITWDEEVISFSVLWLGDHNVFGGAREFMDDNTFSAIRDKIKSSFERADIREMVRSMDEFFGTSSYSLKNLFRDEQRRIINGILKVSVENATSYYRRIFEDNYPEMRFLTDMGVTPPRALQAAMDIIINLEIQKALTAEEIDIELVERMIEDARRLSIRLDEGLIGLKASSKIASELGKLVNEPENVENLEKVERLVELLSKLPVRLNLWQSQNTIFSLGRQYYHSMRERSEKGEEEAARWLAAFDRLSEKLGVQVQL
ncbi:MAG: DUF3536 domain-containing protein [archaeon]|nr:DUF3536 domain-containing protein [archaeon]